MTILRQKIAGPLALTFSFLATVVLAAPTAPKRSAQNNHLTSAEPQMAPAVCINGKFAALALVVNGKAYVPVRALSEGLGASVHYDAEEARINVITPLQINLSQRQTQNTPACSPALKAQHSTNQTLSHPKE